jgi:hypothetical protein
MKGILVDTDISTEAKQQQQAQQTMNQQQQEQIILGKSLAETVRNLSRGGTITDQTIVSQPLTAAEVSRGYNACTSSTATATNSEESTQQQQQHDPFLSQEGDRTVRCPARGMSEDHNAAVRESGKFCVHYITLLKFSHLSFHMLDCLFSNIS